MASEVDFYDTNPSVRGRSAVEARSALGEAAFEEARNREREMTFEQALEYALEDNEASPA